MIVSAYAFWLLVKGIKGLAGLSLEEVLVQGQQSAKNKLP
jgi:hypothetical protein